MSWEDNYQRMILRNKATGYAIYHCKYHLFYLILDEYYPEAGWEDEA